MTVQPAAGTRQQGSRDTKPRILLVSAVSDLKGGAETVLKNMFDNPYIEPVLATPGEGQLAQSAREKGVPVTFYRPTALLAVHRPPNIRQIVAAVVDAFRCARRLRDTMREHQCSIAHSHGLKPHALSVILGLLWRMPTVVHMHDIAYTRAEKIIWRLIAPCVSRVILVSRPCYPGARLPRNVEVIQNGIVPNQTELTPKSPPCAPFRLGFVGRFTPNKGMDLLLDWLKGAVAAGLEVTLTLRGRPDPETADYWDRIKERIQNEGLSGIVQHQGWLARHELYDNLDVLMVPSDQPDPGPLVVTEAMSAGVVVIGYPAGGIPFAIEHGKTGFLCTSITEVEVVLKTLFENPSLFLNIRCDAHQKALTAYSMGKFHKRIATVYRRLLYHR